jgi:hypothetical protein
MIDDLSRTLRAVLTDQNDEAKAARGELAPELAAAQVVFDHPSEKFNPQQTTVDLFLYDIRENTDLRSNEQVFERKNGLVITHQPPMRVDCSYLVTAWPVGGIDLALQEQRLLSQVLWVFAQLSKIPKNFLQGTLREQTPPLPLTTALVDPQKNLSEFWTALGSQLRPSLTITATFSMTLIKPETDKPVITEEFTIGQRTASDGKEIIKSTGEDIVRIGIEGVVKDAKRIPVPGATVALPQLGLSVQTDGEGRYKFALREAGTYKLTAKLGKKIASATINAVAGAEQDLQFT